MEELRKINYLLRQDGQCPGQLLTWVSSRMASSGMLHCVALVGTDVSEELSASIIRVTRISEIEM
jgi:hypothetical protein